MYILNKGDYMETKASNNDIQRAILTTIDILHKNGYKTKKFTPKHMEMLLMYQNQNNIIGKISYNRVKNAVWSLWQQNIVDIKKGPDKQRARHRIIWFRLREVEA